MSKTDTFFLLFGPGAFDNQVPWQIISFIEKQNNSVVLPGRTHFRAASLNHESSTLHKRGTCKDKHPIARISVLQWQM